MIDKLDKMLNYLNDHQMEFTKLSLGEKIKQQDPPFSVTEAEMLLKKLEKDEFAFRDMSYSKTGFYRISFEGVLFLQKSFILKNRPYKDALIRKQINTVYTILKTVVAAASTVVIIIISLFAVKFQNEANNLQRNAQSTPPQEIKVIKDTTTKK